MIFGAVAGAWIGVGARDRVPERAIRRGFALFMVFTAARILLDAANGS